jgi:hypothetical protein
MSDLPHIFPLKQMLCIVAEGAIGKDLLRKLELNGIAGPAFRDDGFKLMSTRKPLRAGRFCGIEDAIERETMAANSVGGSQSGMPRFPSEVLRHDECLIRCRRLFRRQLGPV